VRYRIAVILTYHGRSKCLAADPFLLVIASETPPLCVWQAWLYWQVTAISARNSWANGPGWGFWASLWLARMMSATVQSTPQPAKTIRATDTALTAIAVLTAVMDRTTMGSETVTPEARNPGGKRRLKAWVSSWVLTKRPSVMTPTAI
jgi:hypothetical protein